MYYKSVVSCGLITVIVLGTVHICSGSERTRLITRSDEPAILDSPIKFYATLANPDKSEYTLSWLESYPLQRVKQDVLNASNNYTSSWTLTYWSKEAYEGNFTVTVSVYYYNIFYFNVDTKIIYFMITDQFFGSLDVWQTKQLKKPPILVTTRDETTLIANVHDPSNYLNTSDSYVYSWYNKTSFITNTTVGELKYNFTKEGQYYFNVTLSAIFNSSVNGSTGVLKTGSYETNVTAKVGITNLSVSGPTWFPHGKLLDLNVSCEGSGPYKYCWQIKVGPYNQTGNESCKMPTVTNDCEFPIARYFQQPGIYTLLVILTNQVSSVVNQSTINVYVVHRRQQLSIIVVPVSCSIIAIVLIVFGIAYYLEHQVKYTVEVANFDFGENSDLPCITFLERLRNSMQVSSSGRSGALLIPPISDGDDDGAFTRYGTVPRTSK